MGNDFFDHFSRAIGSICVAAAHKSSDISLQFVAEGKLNVVTVVSNLFGIIPFYSPFLVAFYVDTLLSISMVMTLSLLFCSSFLKTLKLISLSMWVVL